MSYKFTLVGFYGNFLHSFVGIRIHGSSCVCKAVVSAGPSSSNKVGLAGLFARSPCTTGFTIRAWQVLLFALNFRSHKKRVVLSSIGSVKLTKVNFKIEFDFLTLQAMTF